MSYIKEGEMWVLQDDDRTEQIDASQVEELSDKWSAVVLRRVTVDAEVAHEVSARNGVPEEANSDEDAEGCLEPTQPYEGIGERQEYMPSSNEDIRPRRRRRTTEADPEKDDDGQGQEQEPEGTPEKEGEGSHEIRPMRLFRSPPGLERNDVSPETVIESFGNETPKEQEEERDPENVDQGITQPWDNGEASAKIDLSPTLPFWPRWVGKEMKEGGEDRANEDGAQDQRLRILEEKVKQLEEALKNSQEVAEMQGIEMKRIEARLRQKKGQ